MLERARLGRRLAWAWYALPFLAVPASLAIVGFGDQHIGASVVSAILFGPYLCATAAYALLVERRLARAGMSRTRLVALIAIALGVACFVGLQSMSERVDFDPDGIDSAFDTPDTYFTESFTGYGWPTTWVRVFDRLYHRFGKVGIFPGEFLINLTFAAFVVFLWAAALDGWRRRVMRRRDDPPTPEGSAI